MLRISTTQVEGFRLVKSTTWASEVDLIDQIQGKFTPRWQMQAGTAFHSILEAPESRRLPGWDRYACLGYEFRGPDIAECLKAFDRRGVFEAKETLVVDVAGEQVEVVAKCDQILGTAIQENKAKFGQFDYSFYEPSLQWRYYLWIFSSTSVRYNVHLFSEPKPIDGRGELVELKSIERFAFYPYVSLAEDCTRWLGAFVEWARDRNLLRWLEPRHQRYVA